MVCQQMRTLLKRACWPPGRLPHLLPFRQPLNTSTPPRMPPFYSPPLPGMHLRLLAGLGRPSLKLRLSLCQLVALVAMLPVAAAEDYGLGELKGGSHTAAVVLAATSCSEAAQGVAPCNGCPVLAPIVLFFVIVAKPAAGLQFGFHHDPGAVVVAVAAIAALAGGAAAFTPQPEHEGEGRPRAVVGCTQGL